MKFKVLTPLDHDGKRYAPGKLIELDEDTAAPLLDVAAIAPTGKDKPSEENPAI